MNKFKLLAIALVVGTTSLFASSIVSPEVSKDEIRNQIIELIQASNSVIETQAFVEVTFTFSSEGEIVVLKVSSREKEVLAFIRENLNNKLLAKPGRANKEYVMPISLK